MASKKPSGVSDILESLKASTELGRQLEEAKIWERWPEMAGESLMIHGRPLGIKDGCLAIEVDSAVWMHKYAYSRTKILDRINELLGEVLVTDIFLKLSLEEQLKEGESSP